MKQNKTKPFQIYLSILKTPQVNIVVLILSGRQVKEVSWHSYKIIYNALEQLLLGNSSYPLTFLHSIFLETY